ncbi:MAG TPA: iron-sulfur cluster assembly accessory protein [Candidatus Thermoplasmatota archaeon]
MELNLTEVAATELHKAMKEMNKEGEGLKILVQPGGCAGFQYGLVFQKGPEEGDEVLERNGVRIFVRAEMAPLLDGMTIDYVNNLMGGGFKIDNPNATSTCGCGQSFG